MRRVEISLATRILSTKCLSDGAPIARHRATLGLLEPTNVSGPDATVKTDRPSAWDIALGNRESGEARAAIKRSARAAVRGSGFTTCGGSEPPTVLRRVPAPVLASARAPLPVLAPVLAGERTRRSLALPHDRPPAWSGSLTDRAAVNAQIAAWSAVLGLGSWEIRYAPIALDRPAEQRASHDLDAIHLRGALRLRPDAPASQVDRLIVHELLHALMAQCEDTFNRSLVDHAPPVAAFLRGQWERSQEWAIERLASFIVADQVAYFHDEPVWCAAFPVGGQQEASAGEPSEASSGDDGAR